MATQQQIDQWMGQFEVVLPNAAYAALLKMAVPSESLSRRLIEIEELSQIGSHDQQQMRVLATKFAKSIPGLDFGTYMGMARTQTEREARALILGTMATKKRSGK